MEGDSNTQNSSLHHRTSSRINDALTAQQDQPNSPSFPKSTQRSLKCFGLRPTLCPQMRAQHTKLGQTRLYIMCIQCVSCLCIIHGRDIYLSVYMFWVKCIMHVFECIKTVRISSMLSGDPVTQCPKERVTTKITQRQ